MPLVGILGGTFDPIHYAHLRLAQEIVDNLRLTQVKFVLAARPPHRDNPQTSTRHRAEMVRLAIADNPLFALDTRELDRSGPSYSFDTLTSLRAEHGAETPLCLIVGADAFLGLPTWHRWREMFGLAHVVVAHRPGFTLDDSSPAMPAELREEWRQRYCADAQIIKTSPHGSILTQETTALDISASAIRELVSRGGNPRYLLPEAVLTYILEHQLYAKDRHES